MGNFFETAQDQRSRMIREAEHQRIENERRLVERRFFEERRLELQRIQEAELAARRRIENERMLEEQRIEEEEYERFLEEQRELAASRRIVKELVDDIDFYIRTRANFDSRNPLAYKCSCSSIRQDQNVVASLQDLNDYGTISLLNFIQQRDEFISNYSGTQISVKYKTPFQGENSHRVFGSFKCNNCHREWSSASTWKDKWQKCQGCESKCYPYTQHVLDRNDDTNNDDRRPHQMNRCQKCIELGTLCVPSMFYSA